MRNKTPQLFLIIIGLVLIFAGANHAMSQTSQKDQTEIKTFAKAEVEEPIFEFEPVLDGETVTHTFVIKNTGNAELKILKVRTG